MAVHYSGQPNSHTPSSALLECCRLVYPAPANHEHGQFTRGHSLFLLWGGHNSSHCIFQSNALHCRLKTGKLLPSISSCLSAFHQTLGVALQWALGLYIVLSQPEITILESTYISLRTLNQPAEALPFSQPPSFVRQPSNSSATSTHCNNISLITTTYLYSPRPTAHATPK